jgi:glycosyltransferase involved in cell wall biosynthesis
MRRRAGRGVVARARWSVSRQVQDYIGGVVTGRDVVVLSSVDWGPLWQAHQEFATRLADGGNRVVFVENTGVRAPGKADARRVLARLRRWAGAAYSGGLREVAPNLHVCAPLTLPPFGSRLRRAMNRRVFLPLIRRALRRLGIRDPLVITYLPTDTARDLLEMLRTPESVAVYYCAADFTVLTPHAAEIERSERETIESVDLVFAVCPELVRRCSRWSRDVHLFPPSVDLAKFSMRARPAAMPPGPVIGYVGGLHRHVDVRLVADMARLRPEWSWVFVGPLQRPCEELSGLANVHLLDARPHAELPSLIAGFDVCLIPYLLTETTVTIAPTKVNEYLAMGKPVVSTDLPALRELGPHEGVVVAEPEPEAFLAGIEEALATASDMVAAARRRRHAVLSDATSRLEAMETLIAGAAPATRSGDAAGTEDSQAAGGRSSA